MDIGAYVGDVRGPGPLENVVSQARRAARAGLGSVWSAQAMGWDSLTLLAVLGAQVPEIRLGCAVLPIPQRHPLMLASQALTVQAAVGGRLTLGIGAGVGVMTEGMFGLPRDRPVVRMREYLSVLQPLLRGEDVAFAGQTLTAVGQVRVPGARPPQVLLAALGPAMLRVAGELADGTVTWMTGPRTLAEHIVPTIARAADRAGRVAPRVVAGLLVCVTDDQARARARIAEQYALAGQVAEYRAVLDREGAAGPQDVAAIGTEATVAAYLRRVADAGATDLAAAPFGTAAEQARTLELLANLAPTRPAATGASISAEDRLAIHEVISLHGHLADARQPEHLDQLLTADAVYDLTALGSGEVRGLAAVRLLHAQRPGRQPAGHHVTNTVLTPHEDGTVAARSKGLSVMPDGAAGTVTYHDVLVRTDAGWRISHRRIQPANTE